MVNSINKKEKDNTKVANLRSLSFTVTVSRYESTDDSPFVYESDYPYQVGKNIEEDLNKIERGIRKAIIENLKTNEKRYKIKINPEIKIETEYFYETKRNEIAGLAAYVGSKMVRVFNLIKSSGSPITSKYKHFSVDRMQKLIRKDFDFWIEFERVGYDDNLVVYPPYAHLDDDNPKKYVLASHTNNKDPEIKKRRHTHWKDMLSIEDLDKMEKYLGICLIEIDRMEAEYHRFKTLSARDRLKYKNETEE